MSVGLPVAALRVGQPVDQFANVRAKLADDILHGIVLVAEDEPLIALGILELLDDFGATVLTARNVQDALALIGSAKVSCAVLDINLAGDDCAAICQTLSERGIPFLFHTGYTDAPVLKKWAAAPVIGKPASSERIVEALTALNYALQRNHGPAGEPVP